MPGFESLILGDKTAVVFDFGTAYTKCGFAGECSPRFILRTELVQPNGKLQRFGTLTTVKERRIFLIKFIHGLYYRRLLVNPKDRRVVVVESVLATSQFRNLLGDVLYNHFEVPSALFAPAHLLSLFTLGLTSGLVMDCGNIEAVVIPVFEGFTLLKSWQSGHLGSQTVFDNLKALLLEYADLIQDDNTTLQLKDSTSCEDRITDDTLENMVVRTSFVSPMQRATEWQAWLEKHSESSAEESITRPTVAEDSFVYPMSGGASGSFRLSIPSFIRELSVECLFTGDNDHITLATLILNSLRTCPIDTRKILAKNIVVVGGTSNIPGLIPRLIEELDCYLEEPDFAELLPLKGTFRVHATPGNPNYISWLGGAIIGALECLPGRSLDQASYHGKGYVPDWTSMIDTDPCEPVDKLEG